MIGQESTALAYPWIGLIGAISGWVVGQFVTGSRQRWMVAVVAGAIGAWLAVVLSRIVVPVAGGEFLMSAIVAVTGAILMLFAMNRFMRTTVFSLPRSRRRM